MEYSQTQFMGGNRFGIQVLILILMEYSQTSLFIGVCAGLSGLNPYSNGILTDF